ncbi:unnamed protein product [Vicia faba]|uniref:Uncharacterized protein n=1 Tax=Vicia faba TaxID=3906 RepID=A0AAV0ZHK8_VICFA|nr:unnamed protein product [Vicia faba]
MAALSSDNGTVVFIDTNLDTHLALTVSDHDTVSDFKKRVVLEHPLCFPKIGQIQINGIKVKRNGHFYHLSDSMIVKSAFSGYNKSWFLSVDVSALEDCRQNEQLFSHASLCPVDSIGVVNNALVRPSDDNAVILPCNYQLQMLEDKRNEKEGVPVSPCVSEHSASKVVTNLKAGVNSSDHHDIEIPSPGSIPKIDDSGRLNNEVPGLHMECEVDGINEGNKGDCNVYEDEPSVSVQSETRKQKKKRKREDTVEGDNSIEEIASDHPRVSEDTDKKALKNLEMVPSLNIEEMVPSLSIERKADEPREGNKDDCNRGEDVPSITAPSVKKRRKNSKKKKEDAAGGNNSKEETPSDHPHVSEHPEKEAVKNLEVVPSLNIECEVDGSVPSEKKKRKSKKRNNDTEGGNNTEVNIGSVNNPVGCPSERASSFNIFQMPQSENKQDEKEEIPIDRPCISPLTEKKAVNNLEMVPNSHIECGIDGSNKGSKDDSIVYEEGTSSAKKKKKSKRKREDAAAGDISNDNIASFDNPPGCPSERAPNFNSFQMPQPKNKQGEKEEIPFDRPSVSQPTEKEAVKNLEMVPNSHIECEVDGSNKGSKDDSIVCEEGTSKPALSSKKKKKSKNKRQKEDTAGDDISKDNIASVNNPPDCPSERASNFNSFQVPQSKNKQDEKEEIPFDRPRVSLLTEKAVENSKMASNSLIECEVDGSSKGSKDDTIVCEDGTSKRAPSAKKKKTNRRKKEETVQDDTLKEIDTSVVVPAQQDNVVLANSSENANKDSVGMPAQQDIVVLANSSANAKKEVIKETDVLKEHQNTVCKDNNTKNDVNVLSTNEASELMSPAKKKQRKRKKSVAHESKDIIMSEKNLDKMEIGTDACKESMQSTTKEAENFKNQSHIELEVQLSDANEPKGLMEKNENVVDHCHEKEVGQIDGAAAGEVSPQNVDMNGIKEPVKPVKEKKGIKKATSKGVGQTLRKDNGHADASESETVVTKSLKATICDPMPGNTETKENPLNQTEGKVLQQEKMQGTVPSVTNNGDEFSTENIDSPEQTKTIPNAQNVDEHVSKKLKNISNNKQTSTPKGTSDMLTNGHAFDSKKERVVNRIDKAPNAHKRGQVSKLSSQSDSGMSSVGEYRKPPNSASGKSRDLEKQRKQIPTSNAKLEEGFNKMVQNKARKASGNDAVRVVSNSQQKKSLLDGAIFKDDSDSASEDEDNAYNSDASTRTPSDNSIPSDLDGYDSPDLNSQQNGSYDGKGLEKDERSSLKSSLSDTTKLPIEQILRSSARYKKAKITASQLDESETPPEFVPDSLA